MRFKDLSGQKKMSGWDISDSVIGVSFGKTQEVHGREEHHNAQSLKAEVIETNTAIIKINCPTAAKKRLVRF